MIVEHYWNLRFDSHIVEWEEVWVYDNGCKATELHLSAFVRRALGIDFYRREEKE